MAVIFDDRFETTAGAGTDETWADGLTVGAGCTADTNADTAEIGSPANWGDKCFKVVRGGTGAKSAYLGHDLGSEAVTYLRFHIIIAAESISNGLYIPLFMSYTIDYDFFVMQLTMNKSGGNLLFVATFFFDGETPTSYSSNPISLNTEYRIEMAWDATADIWGWKIDGAIQDSGSLPGGHPTNIGPIIFGFANTGEDTTATARLDLFKIDNAEWVGAEPAEADPLSTTMRLALGLGL